MLILSKKTGDFCRRFSKSGKSRLARRAASTFAEKFSEL
jgi:hypothetical protein